MKELHSTFLDLETIIVSQFPNILSAIQSSLEQEISTPNTVDSAKRATEVDQDLDARWMIEQKLEQIQILIGRSKFSDALAQLTKIDWQTIKNPTT